MKMISRCGIHKACLDNAMADIEAEIKTKLGGTHG
jgi:hypothetical protein